MLEKLKLRYIEFLSWFVKFIIQTFHPKEERLFFMKYLELKLKLITLEEFELWMENRAVYEASQDLTDSEIDFYGLKQ